MQTFVVNVFGSEYNIRADREGGHIEKVARMVDAKMRELDRQFRQGSTSRTAVLACLSLVDEQLAGREQDVVRVRRRVGALIEKLENGIGPERPE
uniref:Cell division protein ZapA n=1 Tax=candidate division WOR-3 bacterium TaxID=2052148 RepID=A0A7C4GH80_UNCW3